MKQTITQRGYDRLLIVFAGWGCDAAAVGEISAEGYDTLVVSDYRSQEFDDSRLAPYSEIAVIAWSFGVIAAARFLAERPALPLTLAAAVNGTLHPVDDTLGIPRAIFDGTLDALDERNLMKFYRRTGFGAESAAIAARMDIDALRDELRAIDGLTGPLFEAWDIAFVSTDDRIIPAENQRRAWEMTSTPVVTLDTPHLPPLQAIAKDLLVDKRLVRQRFGCSATTYNDNASVQRTITEHLCKKLPDRPLGDILEVGSGSGLLTRELLKRRPSSFLAIDLNAAEIDGQPVDAADAEVFMARQAPERFDTIVSASTMQWFNSPRRFAERVRRALCPGGTAVLSTFGPDNFAELDGLAPRRRYLSADRWCTILPDAVIEEEHIELLFETPADVLRHIKLTGVNAIRQGSHAEALRLLRNYPRRSDGRCSLTYHPIFIILQK